MPTSDLSIILTMKSSIKEKNRGAYKLFMQHNSGIENVHKVGQCAVMTDFSRFLWNASTD